MSTHRIPKLYRCEVYDERNPDEVINSIELVAVQPVGVKEAIKHRFYLKKHQKIRIIKLKLLNSKSRMFNLRWLIK